jgi:hypothetical protein
VLHGLTSTNLNGKCGYVIKDRYLDDKGVERYGMQIYGVGAKAIKPENIRAPNVKFYLNFQLLL